MSLEILLNPPQYRENQCEIQRKIIMGLTIYHFERVFNKFGVTDHSILPNI